MYHLLAKIYPIFCFFFLCLLCFSGCEKQYDSVVNSEGTAPVLSDAAFSLTVVNTDTINIGPVRSPDDQLSISGLASVKMVHPQGSANISRVFCSIVEDISGVSIGEYSLHDDGVLPDQHTGDGVYSGYVSINIQRSVVGKYWITFCGESSRGYVLSQGFTYQSVSAMLPFRIVRENHPPVLSNLEMDTLVYLGNTNHILQLRVSAIDLDGQTDIRRVFFNSYKPDGSPSSGNPHSLYDDGGANLDDGDLTAGDGIYGLKISLPNATPTGIYRFEFRAVDKSLDSSNVLTRNIVIEK
ncbi:MAG: hypothetical protein JXA06_13950 [Bacteroidetes bacterium]|nr:hypothetical protein [Bacteroidota bacterium]